MLELLGMSRVLVVEDQKRLSDQVRQALVARACVVACVASCGEARAAVRATSYDAIVLGIGLPDGNGLQLLREWRASRFNAPVLVLSSRNSERDRTWGLNLGADDYLGKPFSTDELLARLASLVRRHRAVQDTVLVHRGIRLNLSSRTASLGGAPVELSRRELALMETFMRNAGRLLPRSVLSRTVCDDECINADLLNVYINRLRAKFAEASGESLFRTVYGVGYQLL
jgi:DNA-binding response OmpR family regulator